MRKHQILAVIILCVAAVITGAFPAPQTAPQTAPPLPARFAAAPAKAAADPLPPQSGIVYQVHFFTPGGAGGALDISLDNGAGRQWNLILRPWDAGAQITWNGGPATPEDVIGRLSRVRANVICWPLVELDGAALRADFMEL